MSCGEEEEEREETARKRCKHLCECAERASEAVFLDNLLLLLFFRGVTLHRRLLHVVSMC